MYISGCMFKLVVKKYLFYIFINGNINSKDFDSLYSKSKKKQRYYWLKSFRKCLLFTLLTKILTNVSTRSWHVEFLFKLKA